MPVYLIRHAHAGSRSAWKGDDSARPLSPKGQLQAGAIADALKDAGVGYVGSSPAVRCVETLAPLVAQIEADVHVLHELGEGADIKQAHELLLSVEAQNPALCAHGDLIPPLVDRLIARGMSTEHGARGQGAVKGQGAVSQKGSMWIIEFIDGLAVRGTYVPPSNPDPS